MPVGNQSDRVTDVSILPPPPESGPLPEGDALPVAEMLGGGAFMLYGLAVRGARELAFVGLGLFVGGLIQYVAQRAGRRRLPRPRVFFSQLSSWTIRLDPYEVSDLPEEFNTAEASAELVWNVHPDTGPGTGATIEIHHPMAGKEPKVTCLLEVDHQKGLSTSGFVINDYLV